MSPLNTSEDLFNYNSFRMHNTSIDNHIRHEFQSVVKVLLHFSFSLIQLVCAFAVLALQITLTITQTCAYDMNIGFWSIAFLLLAPFSIWILLWRRSSIACFLAIVIHLIATLVATSIIIISLFVFIQPTHCSTSTLSSAFIGIAIVFKIFIYGQIILVHRLLHNRNQIPTIFINNIYKQDYPLLFNSNQSNLRYPHSTSTNRTHSNLDYLFV